ncbi:GNAT family N-acetyltransferase [Blastomonas aquatica]|uniref:Ribosomal-protein-alanine acetyltransferase n=1 Tax=Blastomonas aquatica TaxID=1510276 RepID=A0ABQ1IWH7_9SPHN|nr:GNAT family N-acetyltransferase [Blastomonas aquatica]GGB54144.1 ribosomal-protein-alanine acetyltransferase [Blastomonas aquatica]
MTGDRFLSEPRRPLQLISGMAAEDALGPVMQVMQTAFDPMYGEAWNHSQTRSMLAIPLTHTIIAEMPLTTDASASGDPVGFSMSRRVGDEEELLLIAVIPRWRHSGAGSSLLTQVIDNAVDAGVRRILLEMRSNNPASRLYHKFGFRQIGLRKNYYKGLDSQFYDALTLELIL